MVFRSIDDVCFATTFSPPNRLRLRVAVFFILIFTSAYSQSYFVDGQSGSDLNPGTSITSPWKTIQHACDQATPGSVVQIRGGIYHEEIDVNVSGLPHAPILFRNYETETVTIDGTGTGASQILEIENQSHLIFQGLRFQNLTSNGGYGILVETTGFESMTDITFNEITVSDIRWTDDPLAVPASGNNANGISVKGRAGGISDIVFDGCRIFNNVLGFSEALVLNGNIDGFVIRNCEVRDNTNIGIDIAGNYGICNIPVLDRPRNGLVTGNRCFRNVADYAQSAGIYIDGASDVVVEKNVCFENGLGIEVGCEQNGSSKYITVKNNILFNNIKSGLYVGGYTMLTTGEVLFSTFRNNTFFQNNSSLSPDGEITISKATGCVFEDNLIYTNNTNILLSLDEILPQQDNLINYNCWYTPTGNPEDVIVHWGLFTFSSFEDYKTGTGQETNSFYGNPAVYNPALPAPGLQLDGSSTCINNGNPELEVDEGETDFNGTPRIVGGVVDIGAQEYNFLGSESHTFAKPSIYPNPFRDWFSISSFRPLADAALELYDIGGRLVMRIDGISGVHYKISREDLVSGIYLYKISDGSAAIASGKLIAE